VDIVVSPYHLTSREAPALCALLLARRVVTMLPTPTDEHGGSLGRSPQATAASVPAYARFVQSLAWTTPLWKQGVLAGLHASQSAVDDVWATIDHIRSDDGAHALRYFLPRDPSADQDAYLSAVASDLLKGGPDPGISLPVVAGLDRFASRHQLIVARSKAESLAQRAEASLGTTIAQCALPLLLQASAPRLLHVRDALREEGRDLQASFVRACEHAQEPAKPPGANGVYRGVHTPHSQQHADPLGRAAANWSLAFESRLDDLLMGSEDDEVRPVLGHAVLTLVRLPWDAALSSSVRALRSLGPRAPRSGGATDEAQTDDDSYEQHPGHPRADALATRDPMRGRSFVAIIVRPLGDKARSRERFVH
jgi:hypothetical protein